MLKGLSPLLVPDLLHALAAAGHGDVIAIVDANFPAARLARRLIVLPGVDTPAVLNAVLTVLPVDDFEADPVRVMRVVGDASAVPDVVRDCTVILERHGLGDPTALDRHAFYQAAADAFVIIRTGERRFYGNILLTKGVIPPDARL
jgi:L-fucose mutarotase